MKKSNQRVPTRFAPATRFNVKPVVTSGDKSAQSQAFEALKARLVAEQLAQASTAKAELFVRQAAVEAAALAWFSSYPLLVFPELLAEKAVRAQLQAARQATIFRRSQAWYARAEAA